MLWTGKEEVPNGLSKTTPLTWEASSAGRLWKRVKNSCKVLVSRNRARHVVGIWTVARSSADSSVDVPMKSKDRHVQVSLRSQLMRVCCEWGEEGVVEWRKEGVVGREGWWEGRGGGKEGVVGREGWW